MVSLQIGVRRATLLLVVLAALPLAGCLDPVEQSATAGGTNATNTASGTGGTSSAASLVLVGAPATEAYSGVDYTFQPFVSGSNGTVVYSISGKPSWLSFDTNTGALNGRPTDAQVGSSADITIIATAASATGSIGPFRITVSAARSSAATTNTAPTIGGTPAATAVLYQTYSFTPVASDAENSTLSFSIVNRPSWASFDTSTGRLSGTPAPGSEGTYANILIRVSDGNLTVALPAFSLVVSAATSNAASSNNAPTISGAPMNTVSAGVQYSFTPSASDPNGDTLVYSVQNLPSWATFNSLTGRIQGTPRDADAGSYPNIVVSVSDGRTSSTLAAFRINVISMGAPGAYSAVLSWSEPRQNIDGTTLTDLVGYHISWGTDPNNLPNTMDLAWAGFQWMQATNLTPGVWYFSIRSYNSLGVESPAVVVSKSIG